MENKAILIETRHCELVKIDWSFFNKKQLYHPDYTNKSNYIKYNTLKDYAIFLNNKKVYSHLNEHQFNYHKIFLNLNRCLIWPENGIETAEMIFNHDNYTLLWKLKFSKYKRPEIVTLRYLNIPYPSNSFVEIVKDVIKTSIF